MLERNDASMIFVPYVERAIALGDGLLADLDRHRDLNASPANMHDVASRFKFRNFVHKNRKSSHTRLTSFHRAKLTEAKSRPLIQPLISLVNLAHC